jgi:hypothetical protein
MNDRDIILRDLDIEARRIEIEEMRLDLQDRRLLSQSKSLLVAEEQIRLIRGLISNGFPALEAHQMIAELLGKQEWAGRGIEWTTRILDVARCEPGLQPGD